MDLASRVVSAVTRAAEPAEKAKPAKVGMVVDVADAKFIGGIIPSLVEKLPYPYSRPEFLYFSEDEITLSADQCVRPVLCPKYPSRMPLYAGYAEVVNAGKTLQNEDQASARMMTLVQQGYEAEEAKELEHSQNHSSSGKSSTKDDDDLMSPNGGSTVGFQQHVFSDKIYSALSGSVAPTRAEAAFFAIFDGHAGPGAALVASKCLHEHIKTRIGDVLESIIQLDRNETLLTGRRSESSYSLCKIDSMPLRCDELVIGALEAAFVDMDSQIAEDKQTWRISGGCAAVAVLVFLGKLFVANAGDCRAVLVTGEGTKPLSSDFTPATERKRLQTLAYQNPELIGNCFSRLEYSRALTKKDLKTKVLFRDWFMDGWASKTVKDSDLRPPLISESSRKKRLLNTIGVSRGFGDHHLYTVDDHLPIKPFLSSVPEVRVFDLRNLDSLTDKDVLIIGSDGLWDVLSNEDAGLIVRSSLSATEQSEQSRRVFPKGAADYFDIRICSQLRCSLKSLHSGISQCGQRLPERQQRTSLDNEQRRVQKHNTYPSQVFVIPLKYCVAPPPDDDDDDEMISLCADE
ncbi:protein phosphatase 2C [Oesophagostomum dentatum]|uniref:Protein phosphatase 2C n=1 Tax=Oesophagostomum dentatum TaxID=61180 RepID=A0A0B1TR47_OESDE|nr:protein phosphatase 2C [Oesophagostomum dentatum]